MNASDIRQNPAGERDLGPRKTAEAGRPSDGGVLDRRSRDPKRRCRAPSGRRTPDPSRRCGRCETCQDRFRRSSAAQVRRRSQDRQFDRLPVCRQGNPSEEAFTGPGSLRRRPHAESQESRTDLADRRESDRRGHRRVLQPSFPRGRAEGRPAEPVPADTEITTRPAIATDDGKPYSGRPRIRSKQATMGSVRKDSERNDSACCTGSPTRAILGPLRR